MIPMKFKMPVHTMLHPFSGFEDLKYRKLTSLGASVLIFAAFALLNVFYMQFVGDQFRIADPNDINLLMTVFSSFVILMVWTVSNWSFCVLIEGKATFKNIWIVSVYSILPYTIAGYINVILGMILTQEENVFRVVITVIGSGWSLIMIIAAMMHFHEFEFHKAVTSIIITGVGMLIIAILVFLIYSLFQQLYTNLLILINEIIYRIWLT